MKLKAGILFVLFFIAVSLNIYQFLENQKYVEQLSSELGNDLSSMLVELKNNNEVLGEIVHSKSFTYEQLNSINIINLHQGVQKWESIALHFNLINNEKINEFPEAILMKMNDAFYERLREVEDDDELREQNNEFSLNHEQLQFVKLMKKYNDSLLMSFYDHINGIEPEMPISETSLYFATTFSKKGFKSKEWRKLLISWDEITKQFLEENISLKNVIYN